MADSDWAQYKQLRGKTLPPTIAFRDADYELVQIFKRDFYAATGLYRLKDETEFLDLPREVVLKIYHTEPLGIIPLGWMGRFLCDREVFFYERTAEVAGLPRFFGRFGESGFMSRVHSRLPSPRLSQENETGFAILRSDLHDFERSAQPGHRAQRFEQSRKYPRSL